MSVERRGTKALELWARRATEGYDGVSISNMTTAWRNGLAFCALIHSYRPDLIDFSSLKEENILENNALAYRVAEQQLGIPALLDAEDMLETEIPDRLSVLTYVSQYYQAFASQGLTSPNRITNNTNNNKNVTITPTSTANNITNSIKASSTLKTTTTTETKTTTVNSKPSPPQTLPRTKVPTIQALPQVKTKTEFKTDKVLLGGRGRREMCSSCGNPVFLAERLLVGSPGQLLHRTCFRCARCTNQLTLASYYETEKGQFCCETCPDEEPKGNATSTSPLHDEQNSEDSDSDSSDSSTDSDNYSNITDNVLEDKSRLQDTRQDTLTHSSVDPKPRTLFLSQTLDNSSSIANDSTLPSTVPNELPNSSNFSKVSSVLFGNEKIEVTMKEDEQQACSNVCDDAAKGIKTVPPDNQQPDTGQNAKYSPSLQKAKISSIVSSRLKIFDNNYNSRFNLTNKNYIDNKHDKPLHSHSKPENILDTSKEAKNESCQEKDIDEILKETNSYESKSASTKDSNETFDESKLKINENIENKVKLESDICTDVKLTDEFKKEDNKNIENKIELHNITVVKTNPINDDSHEENIIVAHSSDNIPPIEERTNLSTTIVAEISKEIEVTSNPFDEDTSILSLPDNLNSTNSSNDVVNVPSSDKEEITSVSSTNDVSNSQSYEKEVSKVPTSDTVYPSLENDIPCPSLSDKTVSNTSISANNITTSQSHEKHIPIIVSTEENAPSSPLSEKNITSSTASIESHDSKDNTSDTNTPHGSKEDMSTASLHTPKHVPVKPPEILIHSEDYPDDLNPFGSDEELMPNDNNASTQIKVYPDLSVVEDSKETDGKPSDDTIQETQKDNSNSRTDDANSPKKLIKVNINPFDSDDDDEEEEEEEKELKKIKILNEKKNLNPFWSDDDEESPSPSKVKPPRPPPPSLTKSRSPSRGSHSDIRSGSVPFHAIEGRELFPSPMKAPPSPCHSSPGGSGTLRLKKKTRIAPSPPCHPSPLSLRSNFDSISLASTVLMEEKTEEKDELMKCKRRKDQANQSMMTEANLAKHNSPIVDSSQTIKPFGAVSKSESGEWRRKKGPAPPRPVPQKRAIRKLPIREVLQELKDIDIKQTELERQGVLLETVIRERTENMESESSEASSIGSSGPPSIEVEDMILQLFELVNEKNELFRRQTELMYLKREKRLEEEYAELEYQIRCLMMRPQNERSTGDAIVEEDLIARLVKVVEQRDDIINCLESDRLREAQEDHSIATHLVKYQDKQNEGVGVEETETNENPTPKKRNKALKLLKKKKKKKDKNKKDGEEQQQGKVDADKDVDESETKIKKKKKWFK